MGRKILKMKGGAEEETWTGGSSSGGREAQIAEKWATLDKMKNGMESGYSGFEFTNNGVMSQ